MARIAGIDLPREKRVEIGLTYIFGIGRETAKKILAETGVNPDIRVKDLSEDDVSKLRDYIDKNLNNELVIADIANKFNYSSSHISHIFKENFGISIKNYIIQKRLSIAYNEIQ